MSDYGRLSRVVRQIVRALIPTYRVKSDFDVPSPAVFLCRHNNLLGPQTVIAWYPNYLRTWVLHVFMEKRSLLSTICRLYLYQAFWLAKVGRAVCS